MPVPAATLRLTRLDKGGQETVGDVLACREWHFPNTSTQAKSLRACPGRQRTDATDIPLVLEGGGTLGDPAINSDACWCLGGRLGITTVNRKRIRILSCVKRMRRPESFRYSESSDQSPTARLSILRVCRGLGPNPA